MIYIKEIDMSDKTANRFAILGLLAGGAQSGYDIRRAISHSLVHFWNISFGSIYPILADLEREGLAIKTVVEQEGKPDRHMYRITPTGRDQLDAWLERPAVPHQDRIEALLKIILGGFTRISVTRDHLERFRMEHTAKLEEFEGIQKHLRETAADEPHYPYWIMTLECGIFSARALIAWSEKALADLDRLEAVADSSEGGTR
jgi:DNA-binding PadR family transcriptional regulator